MAGQLVDARARFTELFELAQQEDAHPARLVDALIGLGDVSRTEEKLDVAESRYREAVRVSDRYNMPFGRIRATVPLFHLQQGNVASLDILSSTNEILAEAKRLGDKTYVANIEMIRAEAFTRIREFERAMEAANAAEEQFDVSRTMISQVLIVPFLVTSQASSCVTFGSMIICRALIISCGKSRAAE